MNAINLYAEQARTDQILDNIAGQRAAQNAVDLCGRMQDKFDKIERDLEELILRQWTRDPKLLMQALEQHPQIVADMREDHPARVNELLRSIGR